MSTAATNKMRGGRNGGKGRGGGVYGMFKSQDEEQQPLAAASVDTSHDGDASGAHVDSVMQHGELPDSDGGGGLGRVHDLTNMLEGTDLDEDHKKEPAGDLDSSSLHLAPSTAHMTLAQTPVASTLQNSFQVWPPAILADFA